MRLAITKGRIELGGEDRQGAIDRGLEAGDLEVKLVAIEEVLADPSGQRQHLKTAEAALRELLISKSREAHAQGVEIFERRIKKRARASWLKELLKSPSPLASQYARGVMIAEGGKEAWRVVEQGLKEPSESAAHKQALEALKTHNYKQAQSWAIAHSGDKGEDGKVAQGWVQQLPAKVAKRMNRDLIKQYHKAEGDFPRRVRLAHMLAGRGELDTVRDTLVVAVKNKKGRIKEELDSAELRVMGWEGLKACRDHEVLSAIKGMMVNLQNREEAKPAVDWLADWVRDNNDPTAKKVLEEIAQQTQYISRLEAIRALGELKLRSSLPIIEEELLQGNDELRVASAGALANMAVKGDEKKLHKALLSERKNDDVREALLRGVAKIGTSDTLPTVKYWLINRNARLRRAALDALDAIKLGRSELEVLVSSRLRRDADLGIRLKAWVMLFKAKSDLLEREFSTASSWLEPAHLEALAQEVEVPTSLLSVVAIKGNEALASAAIAQLEARGEAGLTTLDQIAREAFIPKVVILALNAYSKHKGAEGEALYEQLLKSRDVKVRAAAMRAIHAHGSERFRAVMRDMVENESQPLTRAEAARAFYALSLRAPKAEPK